MIPSIKANEVATTVSKMKLDPKDVMAQLAAIQSNGADGSAKTGSQFAQLHNDFVKSTVSGVGEIQDAHNKVIDTNTLMTAMDDYISLAKEGKGGVPTSFFITELTKQTIAREIFEKNFGDWRIKSSGKMADDEPDSKRSKKQ